jgi:hypothetical protein
MENFTPKRAWLIGPLAALAVLGVSTMPAWPQAKTHPGAADCAVMRTATDRLECTQQLSRQQPSSAIIGGEEPLGPGPDTRLQMNLDNGGGGTQQPVVPNTTGAPATTGGANETSPLRF